MSIPSRLLNRLDMTATDFDPDATTATEIKWIDMRDIEAFSAAFVRTIGTSAITFMLMANTASDGSGTDVDVIVHAVASEPDAVGDTIWLETSAKAIAQAASVAGVTGVRYLSAVVSAATATDEGVVIYVGESNRPHAGLTADVIA